MDINNKNNSLKLEYKSIQLKGETEPKGRWVLEIRNYDDNIAYKYKAYTFEKPPTNKEIIEQITKMLN